jgi:hypothetical protein
LFRFVSYKEWEDRLVAKDEELLAGMEERECLLLQIHRMQARAEGDHTLADTVTLPFPTSCLYLIGLEIRTSVYQKQQRL